MSKDTMMGDYLYSSFMNDDIIQLNIPEEINPSKDEYPHNYAKTSYQHSRKEKLDDIIMEYLTDEETTSKQFASELRQSIQSCVDYFESYAKKSKQMLGLVDTEPKIELF